jgi:hypothetical protein
VVAKRAAHRTQAKAGARLTTTEEYLCHDAGGSRGDFGGGLQRIQSWRDREPPVQPATGYRRRDIDPPTCIGPVVSEPCGVREARCAGSGERRTGPRARRELRAWQCGRASTPQGVRACARVTGFACRCRVARVCARVIGPPFQLPRGTHLRWTGEARNLIRQIRYHNQFPSTTWMAKLRKRNALPARGETLHVASRAGSPQPPRGGRAVTAPVDRGTGSRQLGSMTRRR